MSALELAAGPIERVSADVAVVPLFAAERPLRDTAGRIDWRLCGRLSHLFAAGRLQGGPGEAVLLPGGGGVRAPLVLGLGMGERASAEGARSEPQASGVEKASAEGARSEPQASGVGQASAEGARSEAPPSGVERELELRWRAWVRDALARAAGLSARRVALGMPAFGETLPQRLAELVAELGASPASIELALAPEPADRAEAAEWLRRASQRSLPPGLEIHRPVERRGPQGEATPDPPRGSSRGTASRFTR